MCEDSASFDLTSHDLAQCIGDIGHILELKKKEQNYLEEGGKNWFMDWIFLASFSLSVVIMCNQKMHQGLLSGDKFLFCIQKLTTLWIANNLHAFLLLPPKMKPCEYLWL